MYGACTFGDEVYIDHKDDCTLDTALRAYGDYIASEGCNWGDECNSLICRNYDLNGNIATLTDDTECNTYSDDDEAYVAVEWVNPTFNFDTVPRSLQTIYVLATLDEWTGKYQFSFTFEKQNEPPKEKNIIIFTLPIKLSSTKFYSQKV